MENSLKLDQVRLDELRFLAIYFIICETEKPASYDRLQK